LIARACPQCSSAVSLNELPSMNLPFKRWFSRRRRKLIHICFVVAGSVLKPLPPWFVFLLLMALQSRALQIAYQPYAVALLIQGPPRRFARRLAKIFPRQAARVLFGIGAYRECCALISGRALATTRAEMARILGQALFELGEFENAKTAIGVSVSAVELQRDPLLCQLKAMLDIIAGDEASALESMTRVSTDMPHLMRPHQNLAARSISQYVPNKLDLQSGPRGRLFDLCNLTGQRVTHVGHGEISVRLFESELRNLSPPELSPGLAQLLDRLEIPISELRIIPEEWTTQIGHLGMLDILFRMRELGWWTGKAVVVARASQVANVAFFRLFEEVAEVLVAREGAADPIIDELLSLQRWYGLNFNAFRLPDGKVVPWQEAGALAIAQWEREGRNSPLREEYERVFGSREDVNLAFELARREWGMKPTDWYVCLHVRDAAHYLELSGTGQTHRNSPLEDYVEAIRFITGKGGWVIKLGGENSPRLPKMNHTVDYGLRGPKSELLDIHLIRNAKAFIGTTSGLTNVAVSFDIPSALVNCISTDSQLWNQRVRFALKTVRLADGTKLGAKELSSAPWRWRVFDAAVLARTGAYLQNNTAEEICEVVREVDALASGRSVEFESQYEAEALLSRWRQQLSLPHYYGTGRPSLTLLSNSQA
jgi:putative glycosyltransferase (TIGR04372 family)